MDITKQTLQVSWKDYIKSLIICFISFILIFYGNEYITANKNSAFVFAFKWEQNIPYLRYFFLVYYGIFLLPILVPILIRNKQNLNTLTKQIFFANIIAGIFFFYFPTTSIYIPPDTKTVFWDITYKLTGKFNLFPSLHVTLALIYIKPLKFYSNTNIKLIFTILAPSLVLSTLFTHQHHIADIIGGIVLYEILIRIFPYEFQHKL